MRFYVTEHHLDERTARSGHLGGIRGHARTSWRRIGSASIRDNSFDRSLTLAPTARRPQSSVQAEYRASPMRRLILDRDSAYRGDTPCRAARATPSGRGRLVRGLRPWVLLYHAAGRVGQLGAGACSRRTTPFSTTTVSRPTCRRGSTGWSGRSGALGFGVFSEEVRRELDYVVFRALWSCSEPPGP